MGQPSHKGPRTAHDSRFASPSSTNRPLRVPTSKATRSAMCSSRFSASAVGRPRRLLVYAQPTRRLAEAEQSMTLGRLDYLYTPSDDVAADLHYFVDVLGATFAFA